MPVMHTPNMVIYVKDYADAKFGCVPVAQPKMVASFGLRNRDIQDFWACVMSDADEHGDDLLLA